MLCGLGLGSKPGLGLRLYGLGPLKSEARAGQEGSGWARAEPGLDPGFERLRSWGHVTYLGSRDEACEKENIESRQMTGGEENKEMMEA